ncbi:hypothetical protein OH77DRAFT_475056 [Trametes cingulata]|nr:hypothetical protein OH77DRAFT_475056 [Trametes cingulata]
MGAAGGQSCAAVEARERRPGEWTLAAEYSTTQRKVEPQPYFPLFNARRSHAHSCAAFIVRSHPPAMSSQQHCSKRSRTRGESKQDFCRCRHRQLAQGTESALTSKYHEQDTDTPLRFPAACGRQSHKSPCAQYTADASTTYHPENTVRMSSAPRT